MKRQRAMGGGFIRSVEVMAGDGDRHGYPLSLPAVRGLGTLPLHPGMTILVGENGSGKSTLVEGIAVAAGFNAEGGSANFNFRTHDQVPELARYLRLVRNPVRPRTGFFLRAESFFNVATEIEQLGPEIAATYGPQSLHEISHGESFISLALHKFRAGGLYVLDEPEAAMSPTGCLALLRRFHDLASHGAQFVVATHSPILMRFPDALTYQLTEEGPRVRTWDELDHVKVTREFLNDSAAVIAELLRDGAAD